MTRLGYIVPEFPGQTHAFFWREIAGLRQAGAHVVLFSTTAPDPAACPHEFGPEARAQTCYLFPPVWPAALGFLATRPRRLLRALRYVAGLTESTGRQKLKVAALLPSAAYLSLRARAESLDHVHIHSCANAAHVGALANILDDLPYSVTVHGDLPVYGVDHAAKFARAAFVTTVTRPLQDQVRAVSPTTRTAVITMGVDVDRFTPPEKSAPERPAAAGQPLRVLSVARLNPAKGHVFLLQAMRRVLDQGHPIACKIAGEGPARAEIEASIAALNLGAHVTLLGSVSEGEVLSLLHATDVFALTSTGLGEAAPVAVMEAMATGAAVICSIIGGTPDMIADGVDGLLVARKDVDAITAALVSLATDPGYRRQIGQAARAKSVSVFDYRATARQLLQMIEAQG